MVPTETLLPGPHRKMCVCGCMGVAPTRRVEGVRCGSMRFPADAESARSWGAEPDLSPKEVCLLARRTPRRDGIAPLLSAQTLTPSPCRVLRSKQPHSIPVENQASSGQLLRFDRVHQTAHVVDIRAARLPVRARVARIARTSAGTGVTVIHTPQAHGP